MLTPQNIQDLWLHTKHFTGNFILFSCEPECQPCLYGNTKIPGLNIDGSIFYSVSFNSAIKLSKKSVLFPTAT